MGNNENINNGIEMVEEVVADNNPGIGAGGGVLIGVGLAVAGYAIGKLISTVITAHKAKKELRQCAGETADEAEFEVEAK